MCVSSQDVERGGGRTSGFDSGGWDGNPFREMLSFPVFRMSDGYIINVRMENKLLIYPLDLLPVHPKHFNVMLNYEMWARHFNGK